MIHEPLANHGTKRELRILISAIIVHAELTAEQSEQP